MSTLAMEEVLKVIHRLPSLPTVVMELLASIDQEDVDVGTLAQKIAQDQALTAKALRLANSSFYGRVREVNTMAEAISVLGFRTVRSVVTTAGLMQAMRHTGDAAVDLGPFWRHGIAAAVCARELAPYLRANPDHAYTAGLLHDIGRLVLVTQFGALYEPVVAHRTQSDCSTLVAERHVLGIDHAAIGQALTAYWKFPAAMQSAVGQHHDPLPTRALGAALPLTLAVAAADAIVHALDLSGDPTDAVPSIDPQLWSVLGINTEALLRIFANVEKQFAAASQILNT